MPEPARTLADFNLFEGIDDETRRRVDGQCRWRRYRAGQAVLERDNLSREVFFVAEGTLRVVNYSMSGREVAFADVGVGQYFGELAAIDGLPRSAAVRAVTDTLVAVMPPETFIALTRASGLVAFRVLERLVHVVRACDERIMDLATLGAMQRVYAEILRIAVPDAAVNGLWVVRPCPTEREIASRAGTARETVARAIRQLKNEGLVRRKDRKLYIMDRARLETIARALGAAARG